jgi:hypothetical protein
LFLSDGPVTCTDDLTPQLVARATFVSSFTLVFLGAPYVQRLRDNRALSAALPRVTAALVGVIANLAVFYAVRTVLADVHLVTTGRFHLQVPELASLEPMSVAIAVVAAVLLFHGEVVGAPHPGGLRGSGSGRRPAGRDHHLRQGVSIRFDGPVVGRVDGTEAEVLTVEYGLVEELGDVVVVQRVHDVAAVPVPFDEAEVAQNAELVRNGGLLHGDVSGQLVHCGRSAAQPTEDEQS